LLLRPLELADAEQAQILFPHWEIVKHLNAVVPWPYPPDGARTFYEQVALPAMERGEQWTWSLFLRTEPGQLIGSISLIRGEENRGFWLGLPWHGQGLMTEASNAVTDFWFDVLKFPTLRVPKAIDNTASRRISEKARLCLRKNAGGDLGDYCRGVACAAAFGNRGDGGNDLNTETRSNGDERITIKRPLRFSSVSPLLRVETVASVTSVASAANRRLSK
jgi:RimJ/RimL family protein N-acetyltransferase